MNPIITEVRVDICESHDGNVDSMFLWDRYGLVWAVTCDILDQGKWTSDFQGFAWALFLVLICWWLAVIFLV